MKSFKIPYSTLDTPCALLELDKLGANIKLIDVAENWHSLLFYIIAHTGYGANRVSALF